MQKSVCYGNIGENIAEYVRVRIGRIGHTHAAAVNKIHLHAYSVHNPFGAEYVGVAIHHLAHFRYGFRAQLTVKVNAVSVGMGFIKAQTESTAKLIKKGAV